MLFDPQHVFDFFLGEWSFEREVPGRASIRGTAAVCRQGDRTALYREAARVVLATGQTMRGEQRYLFRRTDHGCAVFFHDTLEIFHELRFAAGEDGRLRASAVHVCKEDSYCSKYELWNDGNFRVQHVVRGTRKDYGIHTVYRRAGAA